jgi:hypothetical protein
VGCCRDKFGAIQHRTAADRQQEGDFSSRASFTAFISVS